MADKKKGFLEEFKEFALRGNVLDMAVGVIIGGAFSNITKSLTDDIISPLLGIFGGANFDSLSVTFKALNGGEVTLTYGNFITAVINFLIMAFVVFCFIKAINRVFSVGKKPEEPAAPTTKICPYCKSEIPIDATRCPHCTSELD